MSIDAYDLLCVDIDADAEEIKRAFKRLSLEVHPDKASQNGIDAKSAAEKFNEIKDAKDILQDAERRKIYDTFGLDLGEDRPEMEVWNIGLTTLLSPMGAFLLKTVLSRLALWILTFRWVARILLGGGVVSLVLYAANLRLWGFTFRSPDGTAILVNIGIVDVVIIIQWVWPLLADTVGVLYLLSEAVGMPTLVEGWKIIAAALVGSLFLAWLLRGWWYWILGLEVFIAFVLLAALLVAAGIMRLWIDGVQAQRGERLREWRLTMRRERKKLQDEVAELKKKVQVLEERRS